MNRRGFFAALASLPFMPKALAASQDIVRRTTFDVSATSLDIEKLRKAKHALMAATTPIERHYIDAYRADVYAAFNRRVDRSIIAEMMKS